MVHLIQENYVIIEEAHSIPAIQRLTGKRKQVYLLVLLVIFTFLKNEAVEAQSPMAPRLGEVNMDASRRTARLAYKLDPGKTKETGIFFSADSASLIAPGQAIRYLPASFDESSRGFLVDFDGLEPDSRYFYKIFIRDRQNKITWSEITAIRTPGFNIRWTGAQKWITASNTMEIVLTGQSVDPDRSQYKVFYSGLVCELIKITGSSESAKSFYTIRLPRHAPLGRHRLILVYKQKRIFEENIDVL